MLFVVVAVVVVFSSSLLRGANNKEEYVNKNLKKSKIKNEIKINK